MTTPTDLRPALVELLKQHSDQTDRSSEDACSCGTLVGNCNDAPSFAEHLADVLIFQAFPRRWVSGASVPRYPGDVDNYLPPAGEMTTFTGGAAGGAPITIHVDRQVSPAAVVEEILRSAPRPTRRDRHSW